MIYEYEVDTNKTPIKSVLSEISGLEGISDIELKKAPIEQVIAEIVRPERFGTSFLF